MTPLVFVSPAQLQFHEQQGLAKRKVTDINYVKQCAEQLFESSTTVWQYGAWGYCPRVVLDEMIATTDNGFTYEVVQDADDFRNGYVKVTSEEGTIETARFAIQ